MDDETEKARSERIKKRAYHLWEDEGRPEGQADTHWDKATELVAIEENQSLAMEPIPQPGDLSESGEPIEEAEVMRNLGEFPTMTDQGEEQTYPSAASGQTTPAGGSEATRNTGAAAKGAGKPKAPAAPPRPAAGTKKPKGKLR